MMCDQGEIVFHREHHFVKQPNYNPCTKWLLNRPIWLLANGLGRTKALLLTAHAGELELGLHWPKPESVLNIPLLPKALFKGSAHCGFVDGAVIKVFELSVE